MSRNPSESGVVPVGEIILGSTGSQPDDYGPLSLFVVKERFDANKELERCEKEWERSGADRWKINEGFFAWLIKRGLIEEIHWTEIYTGDYGDLKMAEVTRHMDKGFTAMQEGRPVDDCDGD